MRKAALILITLLSGLALAKEPLPDTATGQALLSDRELNQRFPAPLLESEEMEGLFLRSPGVVNEKGAEGRDALTGDRLYSEADLLFLEQQNSRTRHDMPTEYRPPVLPPGFGNPAPGGRP